MQVSIEKPVGRASSIGSFSFHVNVLLSFSLVCHRYCFCGTRQHGASAINAGLAGCANCGIQTNGIGPRTHRGSFYRPSPLLPCAPVWQSGSLPGQNSWGFREKHALVGVAPGRVPRLVIGLYGAFVTTTIYGGSIPFRTGGHGIGHFCCQRIGHRDDGQGRGKSLRDGRPLANMGYTTKDYREGISLTGVWERT